MKRTEFLIFYAALLFCCFLNTSCASRNRQPLIPPSDIIGTWRWGLTASKDCPYRNPIGIFRLEADGTCLILRAGRGEIGTWRLKKHTLILKTKKRTRIKILKMSKGKQPKKEGGRKVLNMHTRLYSKHYRKKIDMYFYKILKNTKKETQM